MHPVGSHHEVVAVDGARGEADPHAAPIVVEGGDGFAEAQLYCRAEFVVQDRGEVLARNLDVVRGVVEPVLGQFADHGTVAVDELHALGHVDPAVEDLSEHTHLFGDADRIAANVDRGAVDAQMVAAFDDGDVVAGRRRG